MNTNQTSSGATDRAREITRETVSKFSLFFGMEESVQKACGLLRLFAEAWGASNNSGGIPYFEIAGAGILFLSNECGESLMKHWNAAHDGMVAFRTGDVLPKEAVMLERDVEAVNSLIRIMSFALADIEVRSRLVKSSRELFIDDHSLFALADSVTAELRENYATAMAECKLIETLKAA